MKGNLKFLLLFTVLLLALTGCKDFFTFNMFEGMDPVITPKVKDLASMDTDDALDELQDAFESDSVLAEIVSTPEEADALDNFLVGIYSNDQYSDAQQVQAAVLSADLNLAQSGGDEFVNNVFSVLTSLQSIMGTEASPEPGAPPPLTPEEQMQSILDAIVPPDIGTDQVAFTNLINDLLAANDAYEAAGNNIDANNIPEEGVVTGGTVLNALVCGLVSAAAEIMAPGQEDPAAVLFALYSLPAGTVASPETVPGLASDPVMPDLEGGAFAHLNDLALAAGVGDLNALIGGGTEPVTQP